MAKQIDEEAFAQAVQNLENEITQISEAMQVIAKSRLKQDTLVVLLQDITKLPKGHINFVLNALQRLEEFTLKKPKTTN
jgi:hypothetical protein